MSINYYRDTPAVTDVEARLLDGLARMHKGWVTQALRLIDGYAQTGEHFTAQDLRDAGLTEPDHSGHWGALFSFLRSQRRIELAGLDIARTRSGQLHPVRVWRATRDHENSDGVTPGL